MARGLLGDFLQPRERDGESKRGEWSSVRNGRRGKSATRRDVELEACQSRAAEGGPGRSTRRCASSVRKGGARVLSRGEKKASWAAVGGRGLAWQRKEEVAWPKKGIVESPLMSPRGGVNRQF
jgi:hypothetical protein